MTVQIPFELPFEECNSCYALDPVVTKKEWDMGDGKPVYNRTLTCKGATFFRYLRNNIFIEREKKNE